MRKRSLHLALAGACALALAGCGREQGAAPQPKFITVSTSIGAMSRVSSSEDGSQSFEAGDEISVYAWTGSGASAPSASDRVVDNSVNRLGPDGKWTATPQMLWKNIVDEHYFIGVYPKDASSVADLTKADYTLDVSDQESSDLLIATELDGKVANNNPVGLTFDHAMAKVVVELTFRNQWDNTVKSVESVEFKNVATSATVNYLTKAVTAGPSRAESLSIPEIAEDTRYESVLIPQDGVRTVVITIKSGDTVKGYTYTHSTDLNFAGGKVTTIRIIVGRNQIDLADVTINDWVAGETIDNGEALD